ncbi:unnamed protein product, partial [Effrenium voratum]
AEWRCALRLLAAGTSGSGGEISVALAAAVSACENAAEWRAALALATPAAAFTAVLNAALGACARARRWLAALALARGRGAFDTVTEGILAVAPWPRALQVLWRAVGARLGDVITLGAAISACEKGEEMGLPIAGSAF